MASLPHAYVSPEEYLARERAAETKSEYYDGDVLAMAGASERHNRIVSNLIQVLGPQLRPHGCRIYPSDLKVRAGTRYFYPDCTIVCGEPQFADAERDVLVNPRGVIEVLSETTLAFDRGRKFLAYQQVASLREYVLVWQDEPLVERYLRQDGGTWIYSQVSGLGSLLLASASVQLELGAVYD